MNRRGFLHSSLGATSLSVSLAAAGTADTPRVDPVAALTQSLNPKIQAAVKLH